MKYRPIIFSADMVKAILDGRKTQTRRVNGLHTINSDPSRYQFFGFSNDLGYPASKQFTWAAFRHDDAESPVYIKFPYGNLGESLYVREGFRYSAVVEHSNTVFVEYRADKAIGNGTDPIISRDLIDDVHQYNFETATRRKPVSPDPYRWRPSIHMPKVFSRITLEITGIRVERLNSISWQDCYKEGITYIHQKTVPPSFHAAFKELWDSINGKKHPWYSNPWVWVLEFKEEA